MRKFKVRQGSLFESEKNVPLASRIRPQRIDEIVGQEHLIGQKGFLRHLIENDEVCSMILWGPPGVGKTTLASVIARQTKAEFISFSAVTSGIKDIKRIMVDAEKNRDFGQKTIVFIDEIHRFNKAQQDAFLPFVENGSIILIGATTENPSFEINSALLSRCKVFLLKELHFKEVEKLIYRALNVGFKKKLKLSKKIIEKIALFSDGDARKALNTLDLLISNGVQEEDGKVRITEDLLKQILGSKSLKYDKNGEDHYNLISALHKSMRNSDVDASIYWLTRMLKGGEDPLFIARRLVRFASEDIGLADTNALKLTIDVFQACQFLGMPECDVHLTEAVIYLSLAPKSNAVYRATVNVKKDIQETMNEAVPLQLRNGTTKLMKDLGYGKGYQLAHYTKDKLTTMQTMPDSLRGHEYYFPTSQGKEIRFQNRLNEIKRWHQEHRR